MNELTGWVLGQRAQQERKGEELHFKRANRDARNRKKRKRTSPSDLSDPRDVRYHQIEDQHNTVPSRFLYALVYCHSGGYYINIELNHCVCSGVL